MTLAHQSTSLNFLLWIFGMLTGCCQLLTESLCRAQSLKSYLVGSFNIATVTIQLLV